jgi:hypothetical protein
VIYNVLIYNKMVYNATVYNIDAARRGIDVV